MATLINFPIAEAEKASAHMGFRTRPEVKAAVIANARLLRVPTSRLLDSLTSNYIASHGVSGEQVHPLLDAIESLRTAAGYALSDGRIDDIERRTLQRDAHEIVSMLFKEAA